MRDKLRGSIKQSLQTAETPLGLGLNPIASAPERLLSHVRLLASVIALAATVAFAAEGCGGKGGR